MPKCKHCKAPYTRTHNGIETWCSVECGYQLARKKQAQAYKAETRAMKKALLDVDRAHWIKKAQHACNAYIRERDKNEPCISCQRHHNGQYHAGHYIPSGRGSALRFDSRNIFKQCAPCNNHLSGNIREFRRNIVARLGADVVEYLDANHEIKKWTIPELKDIEREYKAKLKEMKT